MITKLKVQIEEDKRIDEALKENIEENDRIIGNLEAEIVSLRKDIKKKKMQSSSMLVVEPDYLPDSEVLAFRHVYTP